LQAGGLLDSGGPYTVYTNAAERDNHLRFVTKSEQRGSLCRKHPERAAHLRFSTRPFQPRDEYQSIASRSSWPRKFINTDKHILIRILGRDEIAVDGSAEGFWEISFAPVFWNTPTQIPRRPYPLIANEEFEGLFEAEEINAATSVRVSRQINPHASRRLVLQRD
jgi:hypothetical protein